MTITFSSLVSRARSLVESSGGGRVVLGIAGAPASGKTTLAVELVAALSGDVPVAHVPMDGFHLADVELDRLGLRDRKGAPATFDALGYAALLRRVLDDRDEVIYAPMFERDLEQPLAGAIPVFSDTRLIVTEGNYLLLWEDMRPLFGEVWYTDLDPPTRHERLIARHVRFGKSPEQATAWALGTDERNADLIAATRSRADVIIPPSVLHGIGEVA